MRRYYPESARDVLEKVLASDTAQKKLAERRAVEAWRLVADEKVLSLIKSIDAANGTLLIGIAEPALRHELTMMRRELTQAINTIVGSEAISDIRFIAP